MERPDSLRRASLRERQADLRLDVAAVAVVVIDKHQLDRVREDLRSGPRRSRRQVQLLIRQPEDELGAFLGTATQQLDRLSGDRSVVSCFRSRTGRRDDTFCPIVRRTIHWW